MRSIHSALRHFSVLAVETSAKPKLKQEMRKPNFQDQTAANRQKMKDLLEIMIQDSGICRVRF